MAHFDLSSYVDVNERIATFWELYPNGRIVTDLMSLPDEFDRVVFKASVFKEKLSSDERGTFHVLEPDATGWAAEERGEGGMANKTSWHENCETSAIGRALANLGFVTVDQQRPSRQEMAKVERMSGGQRTDSSNGLKPGQSRISQIQSAYSE